MFKKESIQLCRYCKIQWYNQYHQSPVSPLLIFNFLPRLLWISLLADRLLLHVGNDGQLAMAAKQVLTWDLEKREPFSLQCQQKSPKVDPNWPTFHHLPFSGFGWGCRKEEQKLWLTSPPKSQGVGEDFPHNQRGSYTTCWEERNICYHSLFCLLVRKQIFSIEKKDCISNIQ